MQELADSDVDVDEVTDSQKKWACRAKVTLTQKLFGPSDSEYENSCPDQGSLPELVGPSMPNKLVETLEASVHHAITAIVKNPNVREKSREQMESILMVVAKDPREVVVVMKTGGG